MRIAVIGTGNIGGTLGTAFAAAGHDVAFGSRSPGSDGPGGRRTVAIGDALAGADAVLLALPARAIGEFLGEHAAALDGLLVVDATNNVGAQVPNAAAQIHAAAPGARYARAFNTYGWENFAEPVFDGVAADHFFSSAEDDRGAVEELITAVGMRPAYLGDGNQDVVDGVLPLWFTLAQQHGTRHLAFRILER
jgi:predicted dinucleotide-binding enzyme